MIPFVPGPDVHGGAKGFDLRRCHQARMIILMAGERQSEALDRVGDEAHRPVVIDAIKCVDDRRQIVAAEIAHKLGQLVVAPRVDEPRDRTLITDLVHQSPAPRRAALEYQCGI
jgi:hypothetical protein